MKKTDKTTKFMQQGGLMIEALAMLGLIAVVTPTMYKKSAERTLEVEDINTATTVRTYMNAAEAYIANNYGDLMTNVFSEVEMQKDADGNIVTDDDGNPIIINQNKLIPKPNGTIYKLTEVKGNEELAPYLPYKFDTNRALYDYGTPQVIITNNGTNLTAFVLFPATGDIGQERTARIASLVGSNGGYMPNATTARGVGGLWNLDEATLSSMFSGFSRYSLVAASSNVISDVSGGEMDNDKYLQRTLEGNPNDPESYKDQLWRNTMHTDLYMGKHLTGETQSIAESLRNRNSIRDVKSLIIGTEKAPLTARKDAEGNEVKDADNKTIMDETTNNGLYINGTDGEEFADAYIGGALRATAEEFIVTSKGRFNRSDDDDDEEGDEEGNEGGNKKTPIPQMVFGKGAIAGEYNFEVDKNGDIYDYGHKGALFNRFKDEGNNLVDIADNVIEISNPATEANPNGVLHMHLMDDDTFHIYQNTDGEGNITDMQMNIMKNGYKGMPKRVDMDEDGNEVVSGQNENALGAAIGIKYSDSGKPQFPVYVGSNMAVEGIMAAGQVDTTLVRTAGLTAGSNKIDDQYKWIDVDKNGIRMRDPEGRTIKDTDSNVLTNVGNKTSMVVDKEKIALRVGDSSGTNINSITGFDGHPTQFVMRSTSDGSDTISKMSGQAHEITFNATNKVTTDADGNSDTTLGNITLKNNKVQMAIGIGDTGSEIVIGNTSGYSKTHGNDSKDYRVLMRGGWLDLQDSGFHISKHNDNRNTTIFSVGQLDGSWESSNIFDNISEDNLTDDFASYATATHGPAIFTNYDPNLDYLAAPFDYVTHMSVGEYNPDAGVSIMADGKTKDDYVKNVLVIDQSEDVDSTVMPDSSVTLTQYTSDGYSINTISQSPNKGEPGTVYIRKGMIDIISEGNSGDSNEYLAHEGSGVVRAARFVANNVDSYGASYSVPVKLTAAEFYTYNGSGKTRYDTYMVNPAYTSVMNDIKLTSRGGARLSDILPDFINKGIYVANNTNINFPSFNGWSSITYVTAADKSEVTPYLGGVPAPQCPPGYGRVITVAPTSFKMAQVGGVEHNGDKFKVTEDQMGPAYAFKSKSAYEQVVDKFKDGDGDGKRESDNYVPSYKKLRAGLEEQGTLHMDVSLPDMTYEENSTGRTGTIRGLHLNTNFNVTSVSNNFPVKMCDQTQTITDGEECTLLDTYVLSSNVQDGFKPVLFQQSTYLKTLVVPLCSGSPSDYGQNCTGDGNYTQGWAVLMGFIYPKSQYQGVIESIGATALATDSSTSETWFWNLFPVLKSSLEAYATVYCFYDRTNIFGGYYGAAATEQKEGYDYMNAATSFEPKDPSRREKLNDPTLKYDELW